MQEDFLHYIWEFQKFSKNALQTEAGEKVEIIHQGTHNLNSGPDFFNTQIRIDGQLWVGNVEIHLQSGDWYIHHHETDAAYDNVILHVVWEYNTDIYRKDNTIIPTLVLKSRIDLSALVNYKKLFSTNKKWINCEEDFFEVDNFIIQLLAKNFGLKVNSDSFLSMATSFDFSVVRKICHEHEDLESLFLGQVGLLEDISEEKYHQNLKARYSYLKIKFKLNNSNTIPVQFFRLRPVNFPTIRLAQLAAVYAKEHQLFSKVIKARNKKEIEKLFQITTLPFWDTHYNFKSISANRNKKISKAFVDLLIINTISPLQFLYFKKNGIEKTEGILELMASLPKEENQIVNTFNKLKFVASNAMQSQALIELKNKYCNPNKCLQCAVGNSLLQKK